VHIAGDVRDPIWQTMGTLCCTRVRMAGADVLLSEHPGNVPYDGLMHGGSATILGD
jgi:hypothetical protein